MAPILSPTAWAADDPPSSEAFFEARVRPVLVDNCLSCHGPEKQFGGLRLDSPEAAREGGDNGAAVEPGKPAESLLIEAIEHTGDLKMPPRKKLPDDQIATLRAWVEVGAPWPKSVEVEASKSKGNDTATHWSFQPVKEPALPSVSRPDWVANPIDAFVLARLEAAKLEPSPSADRRTLIRRLSYDLIGLPPSPEEVEAFAADESPGAYDQLVDRLLASPHYGERWGRHWLDVARYADSKGYVFQEERRYPFAYTYRDWVIDSFNRDRPYDDFLIKQLAADRLASDGETADLPALGFLTVGRRFLNNIQDITDDRIDVTTRGLLGLTVSCARCHDHKYDPIPTADYYSLYGVFTSSEEPAELPLLGSADTASAEDSPEARDYRDQRAKHQADFDGKRQQLLEAINKDLNDRRADYESALAELGDDDAKLDPLAIERKLRPETLRWLRDRKRRNEPTDSIAMEQLRRLQNTDDRNQLTELRRKLAELDSTHPAAPARAMVMVDRPKPVDPVIFQRGNPGRPGTAVPRQFLAILSGPDRKPFPPESSGRLELARAIASPDNPLTARVFVNRVWGHHFGRGLVGTPSDFGVRSDPPTHPELLDWLASRFVENGWSVKSLHRLIVQSNTYKQQSFDRPEAHAVDPENALLWRQNRQRLEFEPMRDTLLAASGQLDLKVGGRAVEILGPSPSNRRTVYASIDRQNLDGLFRAFDFASPDATNPRRFVTTVPQQALFLMNHPLVAGWSRDLASRVESLPPPERIDRLYLTLFGRHAEPPERERGLAYIAAASDPATAWPHYVQALLLSNELAYID
jgi:mono/diheme cytochrome c family protein